MIGCNILGALTVAYACKGADYVLSLPSLSHSVASVPIPLHLLSLLHYLLGLSAAEGGINKHVPGSRSMGLPVFTPEGRIGQCSCWILYAFRYLNPNAVATLAPQDPRQLHA